MIVDILIDLEGLILKLRKVSKRSGFIAVNICTTCTKAKACCTRNIPLYPERFLDIFSPAFRLMSSLEAGERVSLLFTASSLHLRSRQPALLRVLIIFYRGVFYLS